MRLFNLDQTSMLADEWTESLNRGALACLPTDTVYGLACLPGHAGAVERLYEIKGRDRGKPLAAAFASVGEVRGLLPGLPKAAGAAIEALLPGPVTVIVGAESGAATQLSTQLGSPGTLGIRVMPPPLETIYTHLPTPLALTSANPSGQTEPCSLDEVEPEVTDACDFAVDAGRCVQARPSTVVDLRPLAEGGEAVILREGAVSSTEIRQKIDSGTG